MKSAKELGTDLHLAIDDRDRNATSYAPFRALPKRCEATHTPSSSGVWVVSLKKCVLVAGHRGDHFFPTVNK